MSFAEGGLTIDDFSDLKEIGKGKDSKIYSAVCPKLAPETVVIKVYERSKISPIKLRSVKREARMMYMLTQKNIPAITAFIAAFMDDHNMYIVMEHCSGGDLLEQLLREGRAMREKRVAQEVAYPLLHTLKGMHDQGIIHRDIKLENIFIDAARRIKLGDFGLTMSMYEERAISPVGTLEYMAPETVQLPPADLIINGTIKAEDVEGVNEQVDIWALGVTVYELVTGRSPFEGEDKAAVKAAIVQGKMRSMPSFLSPECSDFISEMMAYDPSARPTAGKLLEHPWIRRNVIATSLPLPLASPLASHSACSALSFNSVADAAAASPGVSSAGSWGIPPPGGHGGQLGRRSFAYLDRFEPVKRATTSPSPLGSYSAGNGGRSPFAAAFDIPPCPTSTKTGRIKSTVSGTSTPPPSTPPLRASWSTTTSRSNQGEGGEPPRGASWGGSRQASPTCRGGSDAAWQLPHVETYPAGAGLPPVSPFSHPCSASTQGELLAGFLSPTCGAPFIQSSPRSSAGVPATPHSSSPIATPLRMSRGSCSSLPAPTTAHSPCHRFFEHSSSGGFRHSPSNGSDPGYGGFHQAAATITADPFNMGFRPSGHRSDSYHGGTRRTSRRTDSSNGAPYPSPYPSESTNGTAFRIPAHGSGTMRSSSSFTRSREDLKRAASQVVAGGSGGCPATAVAAAGSGKLSPATGSFTRLPPSGSGAQAARGTQAAAGKPAALLPLVHSSQATAGSLFERMSSFFAKRLIRRRRSGGDATPMHTSGSNVISITAMSNTDAMLVDATRPQSPMQRTDSSMSEQTAQLPSIWQAVCPEISG